MADERPDLPLRLLAAAVRVMPSARGVWGRAMLAEMTYVHGRLARWRFALSCLPVALFPPPGGGNPMTQDTHRRSGSTFAAAAFVGFVLVAPLAALELRFSAPGLRQAADYTALFGLLWLLPTLFLMTATPLVRTLRAGHAMLGRPLALGLRLAVLVLLATAWIGLVHDQLPCFMGVPNCD